MRLFPLKWALYLSIVCSVIAPQPALADWAVSRTPAGQDILAYCRGAIDMDNQASIAGGRTGVPDPEVRAQYHLGWLFDNWNSLSAADISQRIPSFEQSVQQGGWVNAILCGLRRRLQQLQSPASSSVPRSNVAAKPVAPAPKPMISPQLARDYNAENAVMRDFNIIAAQHPAIAGCPAQIDVRAPNSCWKRKFERAFILSDAMRRAIEAHRAGVSAKFYAEITQSTETAHDTAIANCAKIASTAFPCAIPGLTTPPEQAVDAQQLAASKAAVAARNKAAQEEAARLQAAHQAALGHFARQQADYQAKRAGRPPEAGARGAAGSSAAAQSKPTPHLSDDQKVLAEMLRQQRAKHDEFRQQRLGLIKAQADRVDAITVTTEDYNGRAAFRLINNTDIYLNYEITYSLTVNGKSVTVIPEAYMLAPFANHLAPLNYGEVGKWNIPPFHTRWSAHAWNYDGSWNTTPQGE